LGVNGDEGSSVRIADGRRFFISSRGDRIAEAVDFVHVARTFLRDRLFLADDQGPLSSPAGQAQPGQLRRELTPGTQVGCSSRPRSSYLMTPGLAFFYGGMVGRKNILGNAHAVLWASLRRQHQWVVFGYSLSFAPGNSFWGGFEWAGLKGVGFEPFKEYAPTIPHQLFALFSDDVCHHHSATDHRCLCRKNEIFGLPNLHDSLCTFVYDRSVHWSGRGGLAQRIGCALILLVALSFHISAGIAALTTALLIGKRKGTGE